MSPNYKHLNRKIKRLHWLFLLLAFVYTLIGQVYIFFLTDSQDEYAYYLNLAGRQRMLCQKIQTYAEIASFRKLTSSETQQLSESQAQFDSAFNILLSLNTMSLFDSRYSDIANKLYFTNGSGLSTQIPRYFSVIEALKQERLSIPFQDIRLMHTQLISQLEAAVSLIEAQAQTRSADIKLTVLIYLLGFLLCLWVFIRKGIKPLEKDIQLALQGGFLNNETNHKMLHKVEYANRVKSELLVRATHAFRGGLNGVDGMLSLIKQQPNETQPLVNKAKVASGHMLSIVDALTNYAELTHSKCKVQPSLLQINEFFAELIQKYQDMAINKDIEFRLTISPSVPTSIFVDEKIFSSIFNSLIDNAVNYTEMGSVQIHLGFIEEDNEFVAQIHDTGIGIGEDQLKAIKQNRLVEKGLNAVDNSIGIGLLIVHRAVELLNADLAITSRVGQGTSIQVTIPLMVNKHVYLPSNSQIQLVDKMSYAAISQDPLFIHFYQSMLISLHADLSVFAQLDDYVDTEAYSVVLIDLTGIDSDNQLSNISAHKILFSQHLHKHNYPNLPRYIQVEQFLQQLLEQMPMKSARNAWPGKRILVAEDNDINQDVIVSMLDNYQLDVQVVGNGLAAANAVFKMHFDLILMDVQMPILDGIEATRKIRQSGNLVPIVALTAHAYKTDETLCFDVGMNGFLAKPIREDKLIKVLARFLN